MDPTTWHSGKRCEMAFRTCAKPPLYCQDWQKEMCTLPPSEWGSTGAEVTASVCCSAPLNAANTSAPAFLTMG